MIINPIVFHKSNMGERTSDLYSVLLSERIIMLDEEINDITASAVVSQLLYLEHQDPKSEIYLYINSGGGKVTSGMGIIDVMRYIKPDVCTICFGEAASMAAVILSSGEKGKRYAFKNTEIMIHQVKGSSWGQAADVEIRAERLIEMNHNLLNILAENCGLSYEQLKENTDRDNFMSAEQARDFGLIDVSL